MSIELKLKGTRSRRQEIKMPDTREERIKDAQDKITRYRKQGQARLLGQSLVVLAKAQTKSTNSRVWGTKLARLMANEIKAYQREFYHGVIDVLSQVPVIQPANIKRDLVISELVGLAKSLMGDWFLEIVEETLVRVTAIYDDNREYQNQLIGEVAAALLPLPLFWESHGVFVARVHGKVSGAAKMVCARELEKV